MQEAGVGQLIPLITPGIQTGIRILKSGGEDPIGFGEFWPAGSGTYLPEDPDLTL